MEKSHTLSAEIRARGRVDFLLIFLLGLKGSALYHIQIRSYTWEYPSAFWKLKYRWHRLPSYHSSPTKFSKKIKGRENERRETGAINESSHTYWYTHALIILLFFLLAPYLMLAPVCGASQMKFYSVNYVIFQKKKERSDLCGMCEWGGGETRIFSAG